MKWDCKQLEDLHLVAIVHRHGIKSLRDLRQDHLPLLKNILQKGTVRICYALLILTHIWIFNSLNWQSRLLGFKWITAFFNNIWYNSAFLQEAIKEKYSVSSSKLRIFLHYQPSSYHLHVHFTHLAFNAPGSSVERGHLLTDVIDNIELIGDYYIKKTLSFITKEADGLYQLFSAKGKIPQ